MRSKSFRLHPHLRQTYSQQFLFGELLPAARSDADDAFAKFHLESSRTLCPRLDADKIAVNILSLNAQSIPDGEIKSATHNCGKTVVSSYARSVQYDHFTPQTFANVGNALWHTDVQSMDAWLEDEIYREHCTPCDLFRVIGVSYLVPFHKTSFIAFDYMTAFGHHFDDALTKEEVEYISLPYFLAWLYWHGRADEATFIEWLKRLVGMTPTRLAILRELVNAPIFTAAGAAQRFGVSVQAINGHISEAYAQIARLFHDDVSEKLKYAKRQRDLFLAYDFLRWTGRVDFGARDRLGAD